MNPAEFRMAAFKIATGILDQDLTGTEALVEGKRLAEDILDWCHEAGRAHVAEFEKKTRPPSKKHDDDFGEEEQAVFVAVRQGMPNGVKVSDVANQVNILHHRAQSYLRSLQVKGLIVCRGRSRGARWFLKPAHSDASDYELIDDFLEKNKQPEAGASS